MVILTALAANMLAHTIEAQAVAPLSAEEIAALEQKVQLECSLTSGFSPARCICLTNAIKEETPPQDFGAGLALALAGYSEDIAAIIEIVQRLQLTDQDQARIRKTLEAALENAATACIQISDDLPEPQ